MSKTALITGAGSGIGQVTARTFLAHGWRVALLGRNVERLRQTATGYEDHTLILGCDVADSANVARSFQELETQWGRLDVLFNNAGLGASAATPDALSIESWLEVINVNLNGAFFCAREAFRVMRQQSPQGGRIINNGSISAQSPRPGSIAYTASKHAITGLTKSLSLDGRAFNIIASQVDIGNAATSMTNAMAKGIMQANGDVKSEPCMDAQNVAQLILQIADMPLEANIFNVTIMASTMPLIGRG